MRGNKDHRVLALKDFQDKDYEDVLKRPVFCAKQRHEKEELKYFCKNCERAVCQTCVLIDHRGHALEHIEEEAERQKMEMKSMIETQQSKLQAKVTAVRKLDEDYARLVQQCEEVKSDIQRSVDSIIASIEAKKQSIFSAMEDQTKRSLQSITKSESWGGKCSEILATIKLLYNPRVNIHPHSHSHSHSQKTEIEHQIEVIKSTLDKADNVLTRSTNAEVVQVKKSLETILEGVDETAKATEGNPKRLPILVFVENQKMLEIINTENIGTLEILQQTEASQSVVEGKGIQEGTVGCETQFSLTTKSAEGKQCYNKHDRVTVEIRDEQGREYATEVRIKNNNDGSYKISYSLKDQGKYNLTVKVNGKPIRQRPFSVEMKLFQFRPVFSFVTDGSSVRILNYPWGVAANARDEIAVTDCLNHRVLIFNSDGNYLRSFGQQGSNAGEFKFPRGITFSRNGNVPRSRQN